MRRWLSMIAVVFAATMPLATARSARIAHSGVMGPITIVPRQDINWGRLLANVPSHIDAGDVRRRGEIDFIGSGKASVVLRLPANLVSGTGNRLPLGFVRGDLVLQHTGNGDTSIPDPAEPIEIQTNPGQGTAVLYIGGTAKPSNSQPAGDYRALITAIITALTL